MYMTKSVQSWMVAAALAGAGIAVALGLNARSGATPSVTAPSRPAVTVAQAHAAPPVTTTSSAAAIALAKHLKQVGAKMYGAYWCPHCHEQLQLFGRTAAQQLPYTECAEDGKNAHPALCEAEKVEGYPTWKIKGKTLLGTQPL